MRTTISIDDDVFEAAQALAGSSGKRLGTVISQLARRGLRAQMEVSSTNGLPVFPVPRTTPVIPVSRASELLSDDDLR